MEHDLRKTVSHVRGKEASVARSTTASAASASKIVQDQQRWRPHQCIPSSLGVDQVGFQLDADRDDRLVHRDGALKARIRHNKRARTDGAKQPTPRLGRQGPLAPAAETRGDDTSRALHKPAFAVAAAPECDRACGFHGRCHMATALLAAGVTLEAFGQAPLGARSETTGRRLGGGGCMTPQRSCAKACLRCIRFREEWMRPDGR
jgi:hypothetical protein